MEPNHPAVSRRVFLFGALRIHDAHGSRSLTASKAVNLFAYLLLHPRVPHRREVLADLLSPDAPPERVRRNFSDTLYRLRHTLGDGWLEIESDTVALRMDADLWADVWEFERLAASGQDANLLKAVELYMGDLLPEIYDEWMLGERELRRTQYLTALETLAAHKEAAGELQDALLYTRRLISADPLHEPAHQSYLRLLGRLQRYGEALAHYDYLCQLFRTELDAEPLSETRALAQAIETERVIATAPVLRERTSFVGRAAERAAARAAVENALAGHGSIFAIEGEAGIGKSRFMREIAASARWRGVTVLQTVASETPSASPFQPVSDALAPFVNSPRRQQLEELLPVETLAALAPLYPKWRDRQESRDALSEQASIRFYNALRSFGEVLARLTPLLLAFDDLQWADPVLWKSLGVLLPALKQNGAFVLLAYRRPEIEHTAGWEILQTWDRAGLLTTISLQALDVQEVAQLIGDRAATDPIEIHRLTDGNPLLICEWLTEPTPKQLARQYTAARRLHALSPSARGALESAAVLGESIPFRLWTDVSDLSPLALANVAEELTTLHWLLPSASGYTFVHDLIRAAVYEQIQPLHRRILHERAARAYTSLDPDNARARAFHFDRAGLEGEAAIAYRQAGEQDFARFAFHEAQQSFDRALALLPIAPTLERIEIALALAEACDATGDRARQKVALDEALAGARDSDTHRLQALLAGARMATQTGQVAEAERQLEAALALARSLRDHAREIEVLILFGNLAGAQGKWGEAHRWSLQVLERAQATGNRSAEGRALRFMGIVARAMGQLDESIQWLGQAITILRALGERWQVSLAQSNLLATLYELGAWDRLIATAQEIMSSGTVLDDRINTAVIRHNQALAYYALGEYATARQILKQVIQDSEAVQSRRRMGIAQNVLGLVAEAEGNYAEALSLYHTALASAEAVQAVTEAAYAQHDLGALLVRLEQPAEAIPFLEAARSAWMEQGNLLLRVKSEAFIGLALLAGGDRAGAEELAASGWTTFQSGVPVGEQPQDWLWALYRLLLALDQPNDAILYAAYVELQRQAHAISDPNLRRSFFERVPLNRDIVAAYDRLAGTPRSISVSLARKDAPLGRSLRKEEFVTVEWTVNAPEDEAISDKTERRLFRLQRLLYEADAQDAAPTDDDLARALGVSRRTILRDMQAVTHDRKEPSTRKRKPK